MPDLAQLSVAQQHRDRIETDFPFVADALHVHPGGTSENVGFFAGYGAFRSAKTVERTGLDFHEHQNIPGAPRDQVDLAAPGVKVACGNAVALFFEKSGGVLFAETAGVEVGVDLERC